MLLDPRRIGLALAGIPGGLCENWLLEGLTRDPDRR